MKLISMTDFVLQEQKGGQQVNSITSQLHYELRNIKKYANFLKQPLKLEMFVPCDDNGNVLEEPIFHEPNNENEIGNYQKLSEEYCEAKDKVLFQEFKHISSSDEFITIGIEKKIYLNWVIKDKVFMFFSGYNIEELNEKYNLTLTENAIKQFEL